MASLLQSLAPLSQYRDRRFPGTQEEFDECLRTTCTVYVGNLSFYTTEEQLLEVFAKAGEARRVIMGLDKTRLTPCGFAFVIYYTRADTEDCVRYLNGTIVDDRPIRVDFDWGFQEGRQYGRGRSGGQVRDEYRTDYDEGRGGYGKLVMQELAARHAMLEMPAMPMPMQPQFPRPGRGGTRHMDNRQGGRKRYRDADVEMPDDGSKRQRPVADAAERNPRFRERADSDED